MTDRIVSVGDDLTIPSGVVVPAARVTDLLDVAASASQGAKADAALPAASLDTSVDALVSDPGSATSAALSSTYETLPGGAAKYAPEHPVSGLLPRRAHMPEIRSLITGADDEVLTITLGTGTITQDTVNYKVGDRGWKFAKTNVGTAKIALTLPSTPLVLPAVQAYGLWIYFPDASLINGNTVLAIYHDAGFTTGERFQWSSSDTVLQDISYTQVPAVMANGWNFIRIAHNHSTPGKSSANWGTIYKIELAVATSAPSDITIGHLYAECPAKARMLFVNDRGYQTFYDNAYPRFKAAHIPVTFAIDPLMEGKGVVGVQSGVAMTEAQIKAASRENGNSISYHAWNGAVTSTMTAAQLRADDSKCRKYLQDRGYTGRMWRAAFTQNDAPQAAALKNYVIGARAATWTEPKIRPWPCIDMMKLPYWAIDNSTCSTATIDAQFALLEKRRGLIVPFMHGLSDYVYDVSPALFDYFMDKVEAAIAAGWLEPVTFETLFLEMGGTFTTAGGATIATWTDPSGTVQKRQIC